MAKAISFSSLGVQVAALVLATLITQTILNRFTKVRAVVEGQ